MNRSRIIGAAVAAAVVAFSQAAQASTQFLAYEGKDAVQEGQGGNKKVVDGVDFWLMGAPPRRFQVLGMLVDERWESGIYGLIRVANLEHDIAKQVRAAGGDAVILDEQHDKVWGVAGSSYGSATWSGHSAWGSSFSTASPYGTKNSRYVVVKYLPEASPAAAPVAPPAAPPEQQAGAPVPAATPSSTPATPPPAPAPGSTSAGATPTAAQTVQPLNCNAAAPCRIPAH